MRVQVAYTPDGEVVAGKMLGGRASLAPASHYEVGEFELEPALEKLKEAELWERVRIDVSDDAPKLILSE
jgi:hypothetical protein